jgi:hypothetical protein
VVAAATAAAAAMVVDLQGCADGADAAAVVNKAHAKTPRACNAAESAAAIQRLYISKVVPMALTRPLSSTKHMPKRREPASGEHNTRIDK